VTTPYPPVLVRVPMEPPRELSPNASRNLHWGTKTRIRNRWKEAWYWAAYRGIGETNDPRVILGPVVVKVTYYLPKGAKRWDKDNLISTCKHGFDQLQEARVIANDRQIDDIEVEQVRAPDGIGRLDVLITPLEGA
jgi:Holliday junction resolvase RusA-like endonuclease